MLNIHTIISGANAFVGVNLKDACSVFKKKLGTGATWSKEESAIEVQGDVYDEIMDIIVHQSEWNVCFLTC